MERIKYLLLLSFISVVANAQWAIRESDLPGSNLEKIYKTSPYLVHVIPDKDWNDSNFASQEDMQWFRDDKYGMYIHFGLSTIKNKEISWAVAKAVFPDKNPSSVYPREVWTSWADSLVLPKFSKDDLADIIKRSGVKYVVLVTKHHDGFHFWDTKYSDFKSTNSPYGKDLVREVVDACHIAGVKVGLYYSQRDWYHPYYEPIDTTTIEKIAGPPYFRAKEGMKVRPGKNHQKYIDYQFNAVRELCTNYGKIDMFCFDAVSWNGMFTADMWDSERLTRMMRELQPGILINNRASIPGDYDSPEQRIGMFQNRRAWETCMTLCETWAYSPTRVKTPLEVFQYLQSAVIGDGSILLSWGMMWDGSWNETQKKSFIDTGSYLEKYGESIYETRGGPWLPKDWGGTTFKGNKVYVHIINKPQSGSIELSLLPGVEVKQAKVLSGQSAKFIPAADKYKIDLQQVPAIDAPLIIELTVSRQLALSDVEKENMSSDLFSDEKVYGHLLIQQKITVGHSLGIDMSKQARVKGIQIMRSKSMKEQMGEVTIYWSIDSKKWNKYKTVPLNHEKTDIPVTQSIAGILAEGIDCRNIKLEFSSTVKEPIACLVYGVY